jgi:hypothetical protein
MRTAARALTVSVILLAVLGASAQAQLPTPTVTFIPNQLSAESSFMMIGDPGSVGGSVRMNWVTDGGGYGHLPYINDRYMCYFSDTDFMSTCGPAPFRYPTTEGSPYLMDVFTFDSDGNQGNASLNVNIGGLKIIPDVTIDFDRGVATLLVYTTPGIADSMSYKVFDSMLNQRTSGYVPLTRIVGTPYYNGSVSLGSGTYYIAFKANTTGDFGGGMIKVNMAGESGEGYEGVIQADPLNIDVLVEGSSQPALPGDKRIINTLNQTFQGISISMPPEISRYVSITIPNSTIGPYESMYYTIILQGVSSSLDIDTSADIKSGGGALLGKISVKMKISYTGGNFGDCSILPEGADCLGGICCGGICRKKAECCTTSDCLSGECSSYRCVSGGAISDIPCASGTCRTDIISCPLDQTETGTCTSGGTTGICCIGTGECVGMSDMEPCTYGVCCDEECMIGDCCTSIDCTGEEFCIDNLCTEQEGEGGTGGGIDLFLILIIAGIAAAAGAGIWFFMKKRKGGSAEEEFEDKKDEDVFDEEEFY